MAYIFDQDLEFLKNLSNDQLEILVNVLTKDEKCNSRMNEDLTLQDNYKKHYPNHKKYWQEIAEEIQLNGGNTFVNMFRSGGVQYREVLEDVCDKLDVDYRSNQSTSSIENNLLLEVLRKSTEDMSSEDIKVISKELKLNISNYTPQALMIAAQAAINASGFFVYQMSVVIANSIAKQLLGHGLSFAANAGLTKVLSIFAGPIGWIISGAWLAIDIAGPAYRVSIPTCVTIASLRNIYLGAK